MPSVGILLPWAGQRRANATPEREAPPRIAVRSLPAPGADVAAEHLGEGVHTQARHEVCTAPALQSAPGS